MRARCSRWVAPKGGRRAVAPGIEFGFIRTFGPVPGPYPAVAYFRCVHAVLQRVCPSVRWSNVSRSDTPKMSMKGLSWQLKMYGNDHPFQRSPLPKTHLCLKGLVLWVLVYMEYLISFSLRKCFFNKFVPNREACGGILLQPYFKLTVQQRTDEPTDQRSDRPTDHRTNGLTEGRTNHHLEAYLTGQQP